MALSRFAKYAWGVLAFNILVILWGAFVRATGSGAGCGSHWPTCNGEIFPRAPQIETIVEFTHRLTSGVALLLVFGMLIWAFRSYAAGSLERKGAVLSSIFIIIEALVGAGLVLLELVGENDSLARAIWMAAHLANTFLLLGALTLTAWWASQTRPDEHTSPPYDGRTIRLGGQGALPWLFGLGFLLVIILGMTGAVTALGDTLFPAGSLVEGIQQDFDTGAHFAVRLRIYHPLLAIGTGIYLALLAGIAAIQRPYPTVKRLAAGVIGVFFVQLIAGLINVILLAPVWMQILHLLLADVIWILLVLLGSATLAAQVPVGARQTDSESYPLKPGIEQPGV
jgi:heme A synthase